MSRLSALRRNAHFPLAVVALALAHPSPPTNLAGSLLVLAGIAVRVWAAGLLEKGGELCTDGPYRCVRHPLYLGSLLGAIGLCVMMNDKWGWLVVLPLFLVIYTAQVIAEERALRASYGGEHARWAGQVPMLVPRLWRRGASRGRRWSWARLLANRELYHVLVTVALVVMFWLRPQWPTP